MSERRYRARVASRACSSEANGGVLTIVLRRYEFPQLGVGRQAVDEIA